MRYGVSKRCVTPRWPVYMAGYAKIKTRSEGIHDDLFVRTVLINGEDKSVLIISIDICYFPRTWADNVKDEITRFCGLKPEQILIQATHTHSGPRFSDKAGELSPEDRYSRFLKENILECVRQVFGYQCEGTIEYGSGVSYVGINRRMKTADGVKLAPNPAGPIDKNLSVIRIKNEQGQPVAILFNIACHATVLGGSNMLISADYPGVACNLIEAANGGCMALFMQGTCGDIDPRVLDCGQGLRNGLDSDFIDVDIAGRILAHDVIYICKNLKVIPEIKIRNAIDGTILPFEIKQKSFLEELSKKYENDDIWHAGWTVKVNAIIEKLENGTYEKGRPFIAQYVELAPDIRVIGLEGEIFSEIALAIREVFKDRFTMITGYTNGSVGYVPTPSALAEGGYEVSDSFVPEGRPGPYAANSMDIIIDSVKRLAGLTV